MAVPEILVVPATPDRWDDVATILGGDGDKGCWCQPWRGTGRAMGRPADETRPETLRWQMSAASVPPGFLAYLDGEIPPANVTPTIVRLSGRRSPWSAC